MPAADASEVARPALLIRLLGAFSRERRGIQHDLHIDAIFRQIRFGNFRQSSLQCSVLIRTPSKLRLLADVL